MYSPEDSQSGLLANWVSPRFALSSTLVKSIKTNHCVWARFELFWPGALMTCKYAYCLFTEYRPLWYEQALALGKVNFESPFKSTYYYTNCSIIVNEIRRILVPDVPNVKRIGALKSFKVSFSLFRTTCCNIAMLHLFWISWVSTSNLYSRSPNLPTFTRTLYLYSV